MKFEKIGTNYAKFTFSVTPEEFNHGLDHAFDHVKENVEVKGFRKGHVPRNIYEAKFGVESLYEDALNHVINHLYEDVFNEKSVTIVGEPKVDVDVAKISRDAAFDLSLTFPIKPEVTLGEYVGLEVEKKDLEITDEDVNKVIDELLSRNKTLIPKESDVLEDGDVSIIDFKGFLGEEAFEGGTAENYELKIGSNSFIPGFESQMIGMKTNEERDINVTFPEDYHAENLKGQAVTFKVKLHEIKVEEKEELTDEFVKTLEREGIETVEALLDDTKKNLREEREAREKNRVIGAAVKFAVDNATVDIPVEMIQQEAKNMKAQVESQAKQYNIELEMYVQFSGLTMEQFEADLNRQAQDRVLTSLVIEAIAEKEQFPVSKEEINAKYEEIASMYQLEVDQVKEQLSEDVIINEVRFNKTIDFLEASVKEV